MARSVACTERADYRFCLLHTKCNLYSVYIELCNSEEVPEVEIVSLLQEHIPKYRLRADSLTQFGGYENQDWFIPSPALPVSEKDLALTPDQIRETLNYFRE
ncbi:unnamed protein product [Euphydryas editha]|uniref:HAP1 N-terminal domain-containing protein n=1 Tax=Euphydryas editha TaxID=104508 RepID=A0AAU9TKC1_EUPED|nr:unnamed protein product [Euphydryas editha]